MPSCSHIKRSLSTMTSEEMRRKSKRWQREMMVGRILWGSVVHRTKITWGGGSSRVLRKALEAASVSM